MACRGLVIPGARVLLAQVHDMTHANHPEVEISVCFANTNKNNMNLMAYQRILLDGYISVNQRFI